MKLRSPAILTIFATVLLCGCGGGGSGSVPSVSPTPTPVGQQNSVARQWNEVLLESIRNDFARPTVHARNLFHISSAMYDAWSAFGAKEQPFLLGKTVAGFACAYEPIEQVAEPNLAREQAISYASYRLIRHRFSRSPGAVAIRQNTDALMAALGYDTSLTSTDYSSGSPAALGNFIAQCYIDFGLQDGANEVNEYANLHYLPTNANVEPERPGNPNIVDLDRWQAISLTQFIDQAGNPVSSEPVFLSPEWGQVVPFALQELDRTTYTRNEFDYQVYFDPGAPPSHAGTLSEVYKWNFALVAVWSSHLSQDDGVSLDISPASLGNNDIRQLPYEFADYHQFYRLFDGGDGSVGHEFNPHTGLPYTPQIVPRGDYARVLAEFWADGPESETPPGHWFVLLNQVSDHPLLEKRWQGNGELLSALEWDVKSYFVLGGAMHDVAIAAWGIKGWYDYVRPLSAIRGMAERGQSTSPDLPSYHVDGLPLYEGFIELVEAGDVLAGAENENVGKIKLYAWRGPDYVSDPEVDAAGVGWILAENWWPYQRPTFVTPPFAGYISGHSTFSRAAAEVLTAITGDAYFPGGLGEFPIPENEFLAFEAGPSVAMTLQWATYRDASDQCSLSRIWGGIHPPADDLRGRVIGEKIGVAAFNAAMDYFNP